MTSWVKGRLDADQALYDEICKLDKCEEYAVALYIYHFELLPAHRSLGPNQPPRPKPAEDEYCKGTALPDCGLKGYPWLVTPESYLGHLNEVACLWRDAGRRQAEAQAAFDRIEDLKAKLKEDDTPKSRRTKATEVLKDLKCSDGDDGGKDPRSPPRSGPDPYPTPEPTPDPGQSPTQQQTAR